MDLPSWLGEAYLSAGRLDAAAQVARRAATLSDERKERGNHAWALGLLGERATEELLQPVRNEEARLVDAVKKGETLDALVAALQSTQDRLRTLQGELARIESRAFPKLADPERLRAELFCRAADIRGLLARRESEARRVLQAVFADRMAFTPFTEGAIRGYQFVGTGSYGGVLLGDTCPTSHGGPNGIRAVVGLELIFSIRGVAIRH